MMVVFPKLTQAAPMQGATHVRVLSEVQPKIKRPAAKKIEPTI